MRVKGIFGAGWDCSLKNKTGTVVGISGNGEIAAVAFEDGDISFGDADGLEVLD